MENRDVTRVPDGPICCFCYVRAIFIQKFTSEGKEYTLPVCDDPACIRKMARKLLKPKALLRFWGDWQEIEKHRAKRAAPQTQAK
jgi:hypothetical protein